MLTRFMQGQAPLTTGQVILLSHPVERVQFTDYEDYALTITNLNSLWHLQLETGDLPRNECCFPTRDSLVAEMPRHLERWHVVPLEQRIE